MKKLQKSFFIIFISLFFLSKSIAAPNENIYDKIDLFSEVLDKINKEYVDDVDQSKAMDAAIDGVLQSLDPYSSYMTPDMFDRMQTETSGKFGGLGIEVTMEHGVVKIISPIDNSPASKVGVKAGDYIVKINDIQVQGKSLTEAVELMRGPVGSDIEITVRRIGVKKALIFNITRDFIQVQSVKSKLIDNNIGYLRITSFNENSSNQIKNKLKELGRGNDIKGYILDLRNNPGGLLTQAIKISDFFLDNGEIVSTKGRKSSENRKWFAKKGDIINGKRYGSYGEIRSVNTDSIVATTKVGTKEVKVVDDVGLPITFGGRPLTQKVDFDLNPEKEDGTYRWVDMEITVKPIRAIDGYNPWTPGDTVLEQEQRGTYGSTLIKSPNYVMKGQGTTQSPHSDRIYPKIAKVAKETLIVLPDSIQPDFGAVSYTHLTLPTNREV